MILNGQTLLMTTLILNDMASTPYTRHIIPVTVVDLGTNTTLQTTPVVTVPYRIKQKHNPWDIILSTKHNPAVTFMACFIIGTGLIGATVSLIGANLNVQPVVQVSEP